MERPFSGVDQVCRRVSWACHILINQDRDTPRVASSADAVGELVQAAAHQHGIVGPVEFTVCRPHESEISDQGSQIDADPDINSRPESDQKFFYAGTF
jgi:hypothetical protein